MKNIFKLLGVALIASSMIFVACTKDPEDNNNNNNNTTDTTTHGGGTTDTTSGGGGNDQPTETVMTIAIDGQTYELTSFGAGTYTYSDGTTQLIGLIRYGTSYSMEIDFGGMAAGTYTYDNDALAVWYSGNDEEDYFEYTNPNTGATSNMPVWASAGLFGNQWTTIWSYCNYTQEGPSQVISAIDMNAQTMSCVYYDGLVNAEEAVNDGTFSGREFTLTLTNATWDEVQWSKKSMMSKKIRL